jgi:hypothetical protein
MADLIDSGERATRVSHLCVYCALMISAGARVRWWTWVDDGRIETTYGHDECDHAWHWELTALGRRHDEELMDPADFRAEVLGPFRRAQEVGRG